MLIHEQKRALISVVTSAYVDARTNDAGIRL
jgi:hypothetical protein